MKNPASATPPFVIGYFVVLAAATCAAYSSIGASEILRWDDNVYLHSELVQSLSLDNLLAIMHSPHNSNWHPLTTLSLAIDNALWGHNAVYSKIVNLCLHLLNTFLFYLLGFRLLLLAAARAGAIAAPDWTRVLFTEPHRFALFASLFAATLFALHPQHVESVAWVSERKGLLCAVFYLAALISYLGADAGRGGFRFDLTALFTLLALMSKPMAVSLPLALMLLDIYPLGRVARLDLSIATLQTLLRGKSVYLLLALGSVGLTLLFQEPQGEAVFAYLPRLINACAAYLHYLGAILYPLNLSPFYPFLAHSLEPSLLSLLPVSIFIGLIAAAIYLYTGKNIRWPLVVVAFYLVTLLPVIGIVKVGLQAMADRYAYLPTLWFYLLLGVGVYALLALGKNLWQRYLTGLVFVAICVALGLITHSHSGHWRNDLLLWQRVIDVYPDDAAIAYANLAAAQHARGDLGADRIEKLMLRALELDPDDPYVLNAAANFYGMQGQEDRALELMLRMIDAAPYNIWAQRQVGDIYFSRNEIAKAGNYYLAALKLGEESEEVIWRLAWIDSRFGRHAEALAKLELVTSPSMAARKQALITQVRQAQAAAAQ